jgi:hypothetical protein
MLERIINPQTARQTSETPIIIVDTAFISGVKPNFMEECISIGKVENPAGIKK